MPSLDDELERRLLASAPTPTVDGVLERVTRRWRRRRIARRAGMPVLAVIVVAGTVLSLQPLRGSLSGDDGGGGVIAFSRTLRPCKGHENVGGPTIDAFATSPDGRSTWSLTTEAPGSNEPSAGSGSEGTNPSEEQLTFSPDGTRFAWVDHYRHDLYVTEVATGATERYARGVSSPAWSPDGTEIAFAASSRAPGSEGYLAPPSRIFTLTLSTGALRELSVAPAAGKDPVVLPSDSSPIWSPDGRTIAFLRTSAEVTVGELGPDPDGSVAVSSQIQTLWFMDADGSNPRQIDETPTDAPFSIIGGDWSPDARRFVAEVVFENGNHDLFIVDIAAESAYRLTDFVGDDSGPSWSPDGRWIAFSTGRWGSGIGHAEIAVIRPDGSGLSRVTNDCWDDFDPEWVGSSATIEALPTWAPPPPPQLGTPGVAKPTDILLSVVTDGITDLAAVDPDSGQFTKITADRAEQLAPAWSPDRSQIAFGADIDEPGNLDIYVMNRDGSGLRRLTSDPASESRPAWSPDGTWIAYEVEANEDPSEGGLWMMRADGSDAHHVTGSTAGGGVYPTWSPDGSRIAYAIAGVLHVANDDGSDDVELSNANPTGDPWFEVRWSPDGSRLLFTCGRDLCLVDPDGSNLLNLIEGPNDTYELSADWSPDGSRIIFATDRLSDGQGAIALFVMNPDGTGITQLTDPIVGCCSSPDW